MADDIFDIDANARAGDYSSSDFIIGNGSSVNGVNNYNDHQQQQEEEHDASQYSCCSNDNNDNKHDQQAKANVDVYGDNDSDATTLDGKESSNIAHDDKDDDGCSLVDLLAEYNDDVNNNGNDTLQSSNQNGQLQHQ